MNLTKQQKLQDGFLKLKSEILVFIEVNSNKFTKQDFETYYYLLKALDNIIQKLELSELPTKDKRYAILSSMVVELPHSLLDPKLGGRIITLERKYLELK